MADSHLIANAPDFEDKENSNIAHFNAGKLAAQATDETSEPMPAEPAVTKESDSQSTAADANPAGVTSTPADASSTPAEAFSTPAEAVPTTDKAESEPVDTSTKPADAAATPADADSTPVNVDEPMEQVTDEKPSATPVEPVETTNTPADGAVPANDTPVNDGEPNTTQPDQVESTTASANQEESTTASANQDESTTASANQDESTTASANQDESTTASANQDEPTDAPMHEDKLTTTPVIQVETTATPDKSAAVANDDERMTSPTVADMTNAAVDETTRNVDTSATSLEACAGSVAEAPSTMSCASSATIGKRSSGPSDEEPGAKKIKQTNVDGPELSKTAMESLSTMDTRAYLNATVVPCMMSAMNAVIRERPRDPIKFVISYMEERHEHAIAAINDKFV